MKIIANQNGFTLILALTIVMIMGVMLGMVGQSWKTVKQREQEKELLFRGSQIKEAIENWYNPNYTMPGVPPKSRPPINDLKDLLQAPSSLAKMRFLPQHYAVEVDEKNPMCAPDCAKLKIYQDPMTGKEWTIIRGIYNNATKKFSENPGSQSGAIIGVIGVASKSEGHPLKIYFKDTALEVFQNSTSAGFQNMSSARYSRWRFIADSNNDHSNFYRAYHESW